MNILFIGGPDHDINQGLLDKYLSEVTGAIVICGAHIRSKSPDVIYSSEPELDSTNIFGAEHMRTMSSFDEIVISDGVVVDTADLIKRYSPQMIRTLAPSNDFLLATARHRHGIRSDQIATGFTWNDVVFQTRPADLTLVSGRATKILALRSLGEEHPDFDWRAEDNSFYRFTPTEFLRFAIALDEHVESKYVDSWTA